MKELKYLMDFILGQVDNEQSKYIKNGVGKEF